jgi:exodeoxyribonuclease III
MRVISANLNGIRSAHTKGFHAWLEHQHADVVCLQETKAQVADLRAEVHSPPGWVTHFCDAQKKGYSGVALFSRHAPDRVISGFGWDEFDDEGRYIQADFGRLSVASLYLPSGSSSDERQAAKFRFMARFMPWLQARRAEGREFILCGDWNIAHKNVDLKLFDELGYVDAFRVVNQQDEQYTWWSNRGAAWDKNVGWRIDYHVVTPGLKPRIKQAAIFKEQRFSDHAPLIIDYEGELADFRA